MFLIREVPLYESLYIHHTDSTSCEFCPRRVVYIPRLLVWSSLNTWVWLKCGLKFPAISKSTNFGFIPLMEQVGVVLTVVLLPVTLVERQLCTLFTKMVPRFERSQAHPHHPHLCYLRILVYLVMYDSG